MPDAAAIPVPNTAGDFQQWANFLGSIFGTTGNSSSSETSPEGLNAAMSVWPMILQMVMSQDFSPQQAEKDSGPAVMQILRQAMESGIPMISGAENSAGGYNSTTSALMRNDLEARAAAEGAALIARNKATYGALRTGQANSLIALINAITNSNRVRNTTTTTPNLASNPAARNAALGAAAAGGLANALKKPNTGKLPIGRQKPKLPEQLQESPDAGLFNEISPIMDINPYERTMDDMIAPDLGGGPTPEVTVENTSNMDASADFTGSDNFGDLSGFDQSGDSIDLGGFADPIDMGDFGSNDFELPDRPEWEFDPDNWDGSSNQGGAGEEDF